MDDFFNPGEPAAAPGKCIFVFHTKPPQFFSEIVFYTRIEKNYLGKCDIT